jgi:hypothetical protein
MPSLHKSLGSKLKKSENQFFALLNLVLTFTLKYTIQYEIALRFLNFLLVCATQHLFFMSHGLIVSIKAPFLFIFIIVFFSQCVSKRTVILN